jgi:hypothetical protein
MTVENWTVYFANLLRRQWRDHYIPGDPPFAPARGDEAITYAGLPTEDRLVLWETVLALVSFVVSGLVRLLMFVHLNFWCLANNPV